MPRTKNVTVAGKEYVVQERRIGELKQLVADLFPGSGGKLSEVDPTKLFDLEIDDVLYTKLPELFPGLSAEDVDNAYMSELEALFEAFVDVNFFGLKRLVTPLMNLAQAGAVQQTTSAPPATATSRRGGTTRKR